MYKLLYKLNKESAYKSPWLICVKTILEDCGFPDIWGSQVITCSKGCFKQQIKRRLLDQFRKNGQQKSNTVASVVTTECLNQTSKLKTI